MNTKILRCLPGSVAAILLTAACGLAQAASIEEDIQSLDQETRSVLVQEAIQKINEPTAPAAAPGRAAKLEKKAVPAAPAALKTAHEPEAMSGKNSEPAAPKEEYSLPGRADQDSRSNEAPKSEPIFWSETDTANSGNRRNYLKPARNLAAAYIKIIKEQENHLLITVGDVVYLNSPRSERIHSNERFFIYKLIRPPFSDENPRTDWFEEIGQLRILESDEQLTIGRVIAARDIIQKGDIVFLENRL